MSPTRYSAAPGMADRVRYGEDRWVTACEREQTTVMVPVHVTNLGLPAVMSSPYLEGNLVGERANRT
jgi:hypothetical protein